MTYVELKMQATRQCLHKPTCRGRVVGVLDGNDGRQKGALSAAARRAVRHLCCAVQSDGGSPSAWHQNSCPSSCLPTTTTHPAPPHPTPPHPTWMASPHPRTAAWRPSRPAARRRAPQWEPSPAAHAAPRAATPRGTPQTACPTQPGPPGSGTGPAGHRCGPLSRGEQLPASGGRRVVRRPTAAASRTWRRGVGG